MTPFECRDPLKGEKSIEERSGKYNNPNWGRNGIYSVSSEVPEEMETMVQAQGELDSYEIRQLRLRAADNLSQSNAVELVRQNRWAYLYVSDAHRRIPEVALAAISADDDRLFLHFPQELQQSRDFLLQALAVNGLVLRHYRNSEFSKDTSEQGAVETAFRQNYRALAYADAEVALQDEAFMLRMIEIDGKAAMFAPYKMKTERFMRKAMQSDPCAYAAIEHVDQPAHVKRLYDDLDVVKQAIQGCPNIYPIIPANLSRPTGTSEHDRRLKGIVMTAMKFDGRLAYAIPANSCLLRDEDVVREIAGSNAVGMLFVKNTLMKKTGGSKNEENNRKLLNDMLNNEQILRALVQSKRWPVCRFGRQPSLGGGLFDKIVKEKSLLMLLVKSAPVLQGMPLLQGVSEDVGSERSQYLNERGMAVIKNTGLCEHSLLDFPSALTTIGGGDLIHPEVRRELAEADDAFERARYYIYSAGWRAFATLPTRIRSDEDFILEALRGVSDDVSIPKGTGISTQTDAEMTTLPRHFPYGSHDIFRYLEDKLQKNEDFVRKAVKANPYVLLHLKNNSKLMADREFLRDVFNRTGLTDEEKRVLARPEITRNISLELREDKQFMMGLIKENGLLLATEKLVVDDDLIIAALQNNLKAIEKAAVHVRRFFDARELPDTMVSQMQLALGKHPDMIATGDVAWLARTKLGFSDAQSHLIDLCERAVRTGEDPNIIARLPEKCAQARQVKMASLERNPETLQHLSTEDRGDAALVEMVVRRSPDAIKYASEKGQKEWAKVLVGEKNDAVVTSQ